MKNKCFVMMPFLDEFRGIYDVVIRHVVSDIMMDDCVRIDDIFQPGVIASEIEASIRDSDYIIADISIPNPNVYYELGYATALEKHCILITRNIDTLPFDIKHRRVVTYDDSAQGAEELKEVLKRYIQAYKNE